MTCSVSKTLRPVTRRKSTDPSEYTSARGVDGLAARLLGRHEVRRADDLPALGGVLVGLRRLHDAEVDELDGGAAPVDEEDVGELEVAVDDAARVHRRHRRRGAAHHLDRVAHAERRAPLALAEVLPFEPLHGEEEPPVVPGAVPDVLDDVGVPQVREDAQSRARSGCARAAIAVARSSLMAICCPVSRSTPRKMSPIPPLPTRASIVKRSVGWLNSGSTIAEATRDPGIVEGATGAGRGREGA